MQQDAGLKHVLRCTECHRFYDTVIYWQYTLRYYVSHILFYAHT